MKVNSLELCQSLVTLLLLLAYFVDERGPVFEVFEKVLLWLRGPSGYGLPESAERTVPVRLETLLR